MFSPIPEPPPDACPTKYRVHGHSRRLQEARSVSFNDSGTGQLDLVTEPLNIKDKNSSYLKLNFMVRKQLGKGSYGKTFTIFLDQI